MYETSVIILAGLGTLAIYSYLFGENYVYRFFEHIFIGVAAAYVPLLIIRDQLWPQGLAYLLGYSELIDPNYQPNNFKYFVISLSFLIGLFFYFSYISSRLTIFTKFAILISLAISAGISIKGNFTELLPQIKSAIKPLWDEYEILYSNIVFLICIVFTFTYFIFSLNTKKTPIQDWMMRISKVLLMICFGAFFGSTISARLSLLVERVYFLSNEWKRAILSLF